MRFWWHRASPDAEEDTQPSEATRARERAELELPRALRDLDQTRQETSKYRALGDQLRILREDNHIAEAFRESILGGRRP